MPTASFCSPGAPVSQERTFSAEPRVYSRYQSHQEKVNRNRKSQEVKFESIGRVKTRQCLPLAPQDTAWALKGHRRHACLILSQVLPLCMPFRLWEHWVVMFLHKPGHLILLHFLKCYFPFFCPVHGCPSCHALEACPGLCNNPITMTSYIRPRPLFILLSCVIVLKDRAESCLLGHRWCQACGHALSE